MTSSIFAGWTFSQAGRAEAQSSVDSVVSGSVSVCGCRSAQDPRLWQVGATATLLSFRHQADLLRASHLSTVLHSWAAILDKSGGSAETYKLSQQVSTIEWFISHNWAISRFRKFFCLALHFHFLPAMLSAIVAMVGIAAATRAGFLPIFEIKASDGSVTATGICNTLFVWPVFIFVLCYGHVLRRLVALGPGPSVFLDKTCIHQVDSFLMLRGIQKLGAFIRSSERMLIIYSDMYLTRLWTVYEVACFLSLHTTARLTVIPIYQPIMVLLSTFTWYLAEAISVTLLINGGPKNYVLQTIGTFVMVWFMRRWARMKVQIQERMENFRVQDCECACEEDRPLVLVNIALLMRGIGEVGKDASEEECMEAFNRSVRKSFFNALVSSVGDWGLRYRDVVAISMLASLPRSLDSIFGLAAFPGEEPQWNIERQLLKTAVPTFGLGPLLIVSLGWWCGRCLRFTAMAEVLYLLTGVCLLGGGCFAVVMQQVNKVVDSDAWLTGLSAILLVSSASALAIFNWSAWHAVPEAAEPPEPSKPSES